MPNITERAKIQLYLNSETDDVLATASIMFDNAIAITDIEIRRNKEGNLFVRMPQNSYLGKDNKMVYEDVAFPLQKGARERLNQYILQEYRIPLGSKSNIEAIVHPVKSNSKIIANADVKVTTHRGNEFLLKGFTLVDQGEGKKKLYFPQTSYRDKDGNVEYKDIVKSTEHGLRESIEAKVKEEYEKAIQDSARDISEYEISREDDEMIIKKSILDLEKAEIEVEQFGKGSFHEAFE